MNEYYFSFNELSAPGKNLCSGYRVLAIPFDVFVLQIIDSDNLMAYIITGLNCDDYKVSAAAVRCLHSLSRSVQQLRTTFHDHDVWKPLMKVSTVFLFLY